MDYKSQFLDELSTALKGNVSASVYEDTMKYYSKYIDDQVASGQDVQSVINALGNGRVIAKSVIESEKMHGKSTSYDTTAGEEMEKEPVSFWDRAKSILIIVGVVCVAIIIIGIILNIVWLLLPVVIIVALVVWIAKQLERK